MLRSVVTSIALTAAIACSTGVTGPLPPGLLETVSGSGQAGVPGYRLPLPAVVRVLQLNGEPLQDVLVTFETDSPSGIPEPATARTDSLGIARTSWRLGAELGEQRLYATIADSNIAGAHFSATVASNAIVSVDGTTSTMCAIDADARLGCWLPPVKGGTDFSTHFIVAPSSARFTQVAITSESESPVRGCALAETGKAWCFTVGSNAVVSALSELAGTYPALTSITGAGNDVASYCGLTASGQAWCWGANSLGQLGDGTQIDRASPVAAATATRFAELDLAGDHSCGLTSAGEAWCWGNNADNQAGVAGSVPVVTTPIAVNTALRFTNILSLQTSATSCGLVTLTGVHCWGHVSSDGGLVPGARTAVPIRITASDNAIDFAEQANALFTLRQNGALLSAADGAGLHIVQATSVIRSVQLKHGGGLLCGALVLDGSTICITVRQNATGTLPPVMGIPFP